MKIALKTADGVHYLSAINGGGQDIVAVPTSRGDCELFQVIGPLEFGGIIALRTFDGSHYLSAENGGGQGVSADADKALEWESFKIIGPDGRTDGWPVDSGDKLSLLTYDGAHYLCAENGGGQGISANRTSPEAWETFTVNIVEHSETVTSKRVIHISDPHFTDNSWTFDIGDNHITDDQDSKRKAETLVTYLTKNRLQLGTKTLVITGDLTDSGQDGDLNIAVDFIETLSKEGFEVYSIPGNHDYTFEGLLYFADEAKRQSFINRITGYDDYPHVVDLGNSWLVLLDSMKAEMDENNYGLDWSPRIPPVDRYGPHPPPYLKDGDQRAQGKLGDQQLSDLSTKLSGLQAGRAGGKKVVVCLHHSPLHSPQNDADGCLDDAESFLRKVKDQIDCLLFGHTTARPEILQETIPGLYEQNTYGIPIINCENLEHMNPKIGQITVVDMEWERSEVYWTDTNDPARFPIVTKGKVPPSAIPIVNANYQIGDSRLVQPSQQAVYGVHLNALATGLHNPVTYTWIFDRGTVLEKHANGQAVDIELEIGGPGGPYVYDHTVTVIASGGGVNVEKTIRVSLPQPSVTLRPDYASAWSGKDSQTISPSQTLPVSVQIQNTGAFVRYATLFKLVPVNASSSGFFGNLSHTWTPTPEQQLSASTAVYRIPPHLGYKITVSVEVTDQIGQKASASCFVTGLMQAGQVHIDPGDLPILYKHKWPPDTLWIVALAPDNPIMNIAGQTVLFKADPTNRTGGTMTVGGHSVNLPKPDLKCVPAKVRAQTIRTFPDGKHLVLP